MERRTALALASAAAGTILAASAAFAANVGLLEHKDTTPVGVLDVGSVRDDPTPPSTEAPVITLIVEDPAPSPGTDATDDGASSPTTVASARPPVPASVTSTTLDDHGGDDGVDDHGGSGDDDRSGSGSGHDDDD